MGEKGGADVRIMLLHQSLDKVDAREDGVLRFAFRRNRRRTLTPVFTVRDMRLQDGAIATVYDPKVKIMRLVCRRFCRSSRWSVAARSSVPWPCCGRFARQI